ncbi:hypothetical protein [Burkholderia lata]|uniref:hypothetical protein n=1 Tax=Burkholderia lata (strain ATCC 17760 / DSM 23089 / LMG 22485 / NCIMB 9086 / R18194 / 383) TaxID=482957 RepID=UPI00158412B4|nr:hypothetical protein [Burkholderia lata]
MVIQLAEQSALAYEEWSKHDISIHSAISRLRTKRLQFSYKAIIKHIAQSNPNKSIPRH